MPRRPAGNLELIEVTPDQAREWLAGAKSTYRNPSVIKAYRDSFVRGTWNPERSHAIPIKIRNGRLYDGHHRLTAVTRADITVPLWVDIQET